MKKWRLILSVLLLVGIMAHGEPLFTDHEGEQGVFINAPGLYHLVNSLYISNEMGNTVMQYRTAIESSRDAFLDRVNQYIAGDITEKQLQGHFQTFYGNLQQIDDYYGEIFYNLSMMYNQMMVYFAPSLQPMMNMYKEWDNENGQNPGDQR